MHTICLNIRPTGYYAYHLFKYPQTLDFAQPIIDGFQDGCQNKRVIFSDTQQDNLVGFCNWKSVLIYL